MAEEEKKNIDWKSFDAIILDDILKYPNERSNVICSVLRIP